MLKTNSSEKILKYKSQNNKFKLGSIYLPKKKILSGVYIKIVYMIQQNLFQIN